jgi:hypothetical protein
MVKPKENLPFYQGEKVWHAISFLCRVAALYISLQYTGSFKLSVFQSGAIEWEKP